jgi:hypothetical protein
MGRSPATVLGTRRVQAPNLQILGLKGHLKAHEATAEMLQNELQT